MSRVALPVTSPLPTAAAVVAREEPPPHAVIVTSASDASWARTFPAGKDLQHVELGAARSVLLAWHIGAPHPTIMGDDEEYTLPMSRIELRAGPVTVDLGEHAGTASSEQPYCLHLKGRSPLPSVKSYVSGMSIGMSSGDTELMIVRDESTLHVLHRESSDGKCDEAKQGPLDICDGFEWERVAELHIAADAVLYERIDSENDPFDCKAAPPP